MKQYVLQKWNLVKGKYDDILLQSFAPDCKQFLDESVGYNSSYRWIELIPSDKRE